MAMLFFSGASMHFPKQVVTPPCLRRLVTLYFGPETSKSSPRVYDVACSGGQGERDAVLGFYREDWWNRLDRTPKVLDVKDILELYRAQVHMFVRPVPPAPPHYLVLKELEREALVEARAITQDGLDTVDTELRCNHSLMESILELLEVCKYPGLGDRSGTY
jgi:hypothetical protein